MRALRRLGSLLLLACVPLRAEPAWEPAQEVAAGRGEKGPWQQNESRYDYVDDPVAVADLEGVAVAWVDQGRKDVFFRRMPSGGAVNVSRSPQTFSWLPRMALAEDAPRRILLLWQEIVFSGGSHGGDMLFARSDDGGRTFSAPRNLSRSVGGDGKGRINEKVWDNGSYDLAAGPGGKVYAAWTDYEGALWLSRSEDSGESFGAPRQVAGNAREPARAPSIAPGKDGVLYLAWTTGENARADIRVARSDDGGASFGPPEAVAPDAGYSDAPRLAVAPDGVLHLAYAQSDGGPFGRFHVRHARARDGGGFEPPRVVSEPLPNGAVGAAFPALEIDGDGRVVIVYELFPDPGRRPFGLGLSVSADGGRSFGRPARIPHSRDASGAPNGSRQGLLMDKLALAGRGGIVVVNSSLDQGRRSRVWLMRGQLAP